MKLQAQIIDNTANSLLQLGAIGILIILMGAGLYFISKYFSNQLKSERERNDKLSEKLLEVVTGALQSNNEVIKVLEKNFNEIKIQIEILKTK